MDLFEGLKIDRAHLEQTNPAVYSAWKTLFLLTKAGDPDAAAILEKLGGDPLSEGNRKAGPKLAEVVHTEARFRTMSLLAEQSGGEICIDLPCGYTPRALEFAKKGIPYIGMDLPAAEEEAKSVILPLLPPKKETQVCFRAVDATNYHTLETALHGRKGSVCILTEGLLPYLTASETGVLCDNIRRILAEHGGCWITSDPEASISYALTLQVFGGDSKQAFGGDSKQADLGAAADSANVNARADVNAGVSAGLRAGVNAGMDADVDIGVNPLTVNSEDAENGITSAMMFLAKHGLKAERIIAAAHLPELISLRPFDPEKAAAYLAAMEHCAFWKVTPLSDELHASETNSGHFSASGALIDRILYLQLTGRLDTISAPNLLAFYEQYREDLSIAYIDCSRLDYISSAGLRVLLILQKRTNRGIILSETNDTVREILDQTGFSEILTVE